MPHVRPLMWQAAQERPILRYGDILCAGLDHDKGIRGVRMVHQQGGGGSGCQWEVVVRLHGAGEMGGLPPGLPICRHTPGRLGADNAAAPQGDGLPEHQACIVQMLLPDYLSIFPVLTLCMHTLVLRPKSIWKSFCSESLTCRVPSQKTPHSFCFWHHTL